MKILIYSDLHLEFAEFAPEQTDADVVILAGDTHLGVKGVRWAQEHFPNQPVLYILGNHEYYGQAYPKLLEELKNQTRGSNIHILENDTFTIEDTTFVGCTLWTDFALFGDARVAGIEATRIMSDYKKIRISPQFSKLRSINTVMIHQKSKRFLEQRFLELQGKKLVVITHHAPSKQSLPVEYQNDLLSAAYASSLDELIKKSGAALWIHGHIHQAQDYLIGQTRIIANPRGYPDETNHGFQENLVLEI